MPAYAPTLANVGTNLPLSPDQTRALQLTGGAMPPRDSGDMPQDVQQELQHWGDPFYALSSLGGQAADLIQSATGWRPGTTPSWVPQWARDVSTKLTTGTEQSKQDISDLTKRVTGQPMTDEDWNMLLSLGMTEGSVRGVRGGRGRAVAPKDPGAELRGTAPETPAAPEAPAAAGTAPETPPGVGHNLPPEPTAPETPAEASAPDVGPEGAGTPEPAAARKSIRQNIEEAVAAQEHPVKKPGINGLTNPMPHPEDYQAGIQRGLNRSFDSGAAPPVVKLGKNEYLGNVNLAQWKQRMEGQLSPDEITQARNWYKDALPAYERHFGEEDAPAMMGAWLIANRNVDPAGAQLNALRVAEQTSNLTPQFGVQKQGGLADAALRDYWNAIKSGDLSGLSRLGGQKIYDFIDSALGKDTRTFYGDDPRMGAPAVADVHSLRDMGHIDDPTINWVRQKYGDEAANNLTKSFGGSPGEAQYEWSADKMRRFANQLNKQNYMGGGWTPSQVQATGWMTMSKMLGRSGQTAEQAILAHTRNVSSELDFGAGAPYHEQFPDWAGLTPDQKAQVTQEVMPLAHNFARELTGAHGGEPTVGIGGWGPYTNPSMKTRLIASPEVAGDYADVLGHLAQQTEVFGYRPEENGTTLGVAVHGEGLQNPDAVRRFWSAFTAKHPDLAAGFSPSIHPNGTPGIEMLFDKGGKKMQARIDNEVAPSIDQIAQGMGLKTNIRVFQASKWSRGNDWQKDPTGGEYLSRLSARYGPDLPNRLELYRREQFEPAIRQAIERAKAGGAPEGAPPEAGPEVSPTAPDLGAVSRQPSAKNLGIAAAGLGLGAAGMAGQSQAAEPGAPNMPIATPTPAGGPSSIRALLLDALAKQGRGGDTQLAHVSPKAAKKLKGMGGSGTINPDTGLPEFQPMGMQGFASPAAKAAAAVPFGAPGAASAGAPGTPGLPPSPAAFDPQRALLAAMPTSPQQMPAYTGAQLPPAAPGAPGAGAPGAPPMTAGMGIAGSPGLPKPGVPGLPPSPAAFDPMRAQLAAMPTSPQQMRGYTGAQLPPAAPGAAGAGSPAAFDPMRGQLAGMPSAPPTGAPPGMPPGALPAMPGTPPPGMGGGMGASQPMNQQAVADAGRRRLIMQALANRGQNGDTMLAHINPQEARALMLTGGAGTTNPATGLPQFYGGDPDAGGVGGSVGRDSLNPDPALTAQPAQPDQPDWGERLIAKMKKNPGMFGGLLGTLGGSALGPMGGALGGLLGVGAGLGGKALGLWGDSSGATSGTPSPGGTNPYLLARLGNLFG